MHQAIELLELVACDLLARRPGRLRGQELLGAVQNWGTTVESNLWTLCKECNRGKSAQTLPEA